MRSRYWTFLEECDQKRSIRAVKDLLTSTLREIGIETYVITTHIPARDLRSLGVLVSTWPADAVDHLFIGRAEGFINPLFEAAEHRSDLILWETRDWTASLRKDQRVWLDRMMQLMPGHGVTRSMQSMLVSASCSLTADHLPDPECMRLCMRIANYAYQHIQVLQRPKLSEADQLTAREHECLYRAVLRGERPSAVARGLGVKVSTVRTLRQKAYGRLDADSPEQAVWRMMETGQLFGGGRRRKKRQT